MLGKALQRTVSRGLKFPSTAAFATVMENSVRITFVDREGNRATVPGKIGSSILETAQLHKIDLQGSCENTFTRTYAKRSDIWTENIFGEGPSCFYCHVQIPNQFNHLLPELNQDEKEGLDFLWEEESNASSRLACMIKLEKKHDGLVVLVPDAPPNDII